MTPTPLAARPSLWGMMLAAAGILLLNMGARQSLGLFIAPLDDARGLGLVSISFAFAVSQLVWGIAQPAFGALVERWGSFKVIVLGSLLVALGTGLTPFAHSSATLTLTLGILAAAGAGAGSFSILIGWLARYLPDHRRAFAAGFINAGSSLGQFLFAPFTQWLIETFGWVIALQVLAVSALGVIPLAWALGRQVTAHTPPILSGAALRLGAQIRSALRDRSYLLQPGDSLFFDAEASHGPEELRRLPARFFSPSVRACTWMSVTRVRNSNASSPRPPPGSSRSRSRPRSPNSGSNSRSVRGP